MANLQKDFAVVGQSANTGMNVEIPAEYADDPDMWEAIKASL